jgi:hypothetical protein
MPEKIDFFSIPKIN